MIYMLLLSLLCIFSIAQDPNDNSTLDMLIGVISVYKTKAVSLGDIIQPYAS